MGPTEVMYDILGLVFILVIAGVAFFALGGFEGIGKWFDDLTGSETTSADDETAENSFKRC